MIINTGEELLKEYTKLFKLAKGDPDSCPGVIWARNYVKKNPYSSCFEMIAEIGLNIKKGTADHGWLIMILKLCWSILSQDQRLNIIDMLYEGGAYKWIVPLKKDKLTDVEKEKLRFYLEKDNSIKSLEMLDG